MCSGTAFRAQLTALGIAQIDQPSEVGTPVLKCRPIATDLILTSDTHISAWGQGASLQETVFGWEHSEAEWGHDATCLKLMVRPGCMICPALLL